MGWSRTNSWLHSILPVIFRVIAHAMVSSGRTLRLWATAMLGHRRRASNLETLHLDHTLGRTWPTQRCSQLSWFSLDLGSALSAFTGVDFRRRLTGSDFGPPLTPRVFVGRLAVALCAPHMLVAFARVVAHDFVARLAPSPPTGWPRLPSPSSRAGSRARGSSSSQGRRAALRLPCNIRGCFDMGRGLPGIPHRERRVATAPASLASLSALSHGWQRRPSSALLSLLEARAYSV